MWMGIDPHLLLFALLPPLLAGDAMQMDTNVAQAVAKQCLFLAGPGVVVNAALHTSLCEHQVLYRTIALACIGHRTIALACIVIL